MSKYSELLKDPRWQRKRLEILQRDQFACSQCGEDVNCLHVHHRYYVRGRDPWNYPGWALVTLCVNCHDDITNPRPRDPEELVATLDEWEIAGDFITSGGKRTIGVMWEFGAEIAQLYDDGFHPSEIMALLRNARKEATV